MKRRKLIDVCRMCSRRTPGRFEYCIRSPRLVLRWRGAISSIRIKIECAMNEIVGIDLGTTNSLIGVMDAGFPILLADKNGARLTPSVVHFPAEGEPLIGQPAARMRVLKPEQTIYSIKRFMGVRGDELRNEDVAVPYRIERQSGKAVSV